MASPLKSGKQSVKLGAPVRGSRIRRDPPPIVKKAPVRDTEERETVTVVVGVASFAIAIAIIILGVSAYYGSSEPAEELTVNVGNL